MSRKEILTDSPVPPKYADLPVGLAIRAEDSIRIGGHLIESYEMPDGTERVMVDGREVQCSYREAMRAVARMKP